MALRSIRGTKMELAVNSLPTANAEATRFFQQWLETFSSYVREVDYASARPLFHPDVLAFGTHNDVIPGLEQWITTQWDNVWPKTSDFRFTLEQTEVLAASDGSMAIVIAPWTSTGYHQAATVSAAGPRHHGLSQSTRRLAVHPFPHVAQPRGPAVQPRQSAGEGVVTGAHPSAPRNSSAFSRDGNRPSSR